MERVGSYGKAVALPAVAPIFLSLLLCSVFPQAVASDGGTAFRKNVLYEKPYQRGTILAGDADKFFEEDQRTYDSSQSANTQEGLLRRRKRSSSISARDMLRGKATVPKLSSMRMGFGLVLMFVAASLWGLGRVVMQCLGKAESLNQTGRAGSNPRLLGDQRTDVCEDLGLGLPGKSGSPAADDLENAGRTVVTRQRRRLLLLLVLEASIFLAAIAALSYVVANRMATQTYSSPPQSQQSMQNAPGHMIYLRALCRDAHNCEVAQTPARHESFDAVQIGDTRVELKFSVGTKGMFERKGMWDSVGRTCAEQALEALGTAYRPSIGYRFTCTVNESALDTPLQAVSRGGQL